MRISRQRFLERVKSRRLRLHTGNDADSQPLLWTVSLYCLDVHEDVGQQSQIPQNFDFQPKISSWMP
ncbi:hypothetical protein CEXT_417001 [Caerostris extrusa]|uniref:Uncharacterized protein n=1 Tax=Caerostris extrusa TaxID=172846 RepID=A0AAV4T6Y0_CAEEX|nr:hypothetical protein CEXT_417001 [Caerostris extrusa]